VEGARPATPEDVPQLAELNRMAMAELAELRGGKVFVAKEARADLVDLGDADRLVLAGTVDDTPVGYAVVHTEDLRDGTRIGVVTDLYVEPEARGVAVGECLMNALLEWCSQRGCAGVDSYALPGDRSTKNFFEGSGFTARLLVMHHKMVED
jgi:GNAT superfamily N-acetyltransferase